MILERNIQGLTDSGDGHPDEDTGGGRTQVDGIPWLGDVGPDPVDGRVASATMAIASFSGSAALGIFLSSRLIHAHAALLLSLRLFPGICVSAHAQSQWRQFRKIVKCVVVSGLVEN